MKLSELEYKSYLDQVLIPYFKGIMHENIFSVLLDRECKGLICTKRTADAFGFKSWEEIIGLSYEDYENIPLLHNIFKSALTKGNMQSIADYCKKIHQVQQFVLKTHKVVSVIDFLPYAGQLNSYLITYVPVFHPNHEVVGIQTYSIESRSFGFQEQMMLSSTPAKRNHLSDKNFTKRELEILFLLANAVTQDQIAQMLNISRSTVATVISSQLCAKFDIAGSNTKLLGKAAIEGGFHHRMPPSLWRPCVIILENELADMVIG